MRESLLFLTFSPWNIICIHSVDMWAGFILEIGHWSWGSNGPPSLIFEDPFSRNGAKKGGSKSKKTECFLRLLTFYMGHTCWMLCRNFGTFWATEKAWAKITAHPRCLSGEMTQTKKRKAIETVRGYKSSKQVYRVAIKSVLLSVMFLNTLFWKKYLSLGPFFVWPIWRGNKNFMRHFSK